MLIGALVTLSSLVSVPAAQLLTYAMGANPKTLQMAMSVVGACVVAVDMACHFWIMTPIMRARVGIDEDSTPTERTRLIRDARYVCAATSASRSLLRTAGPVVWFSQHSCGL